MCTIYKLTDLRFLGIMGSDQKRGDHMSSDAHRKAVAKFQATKARVNVWMTPDGKEKLTEYVKNTPEKSVQKYLLRLIKEESGIDCEGSSAD